jgi:hypothetical protein
MTVRLYADHKQIPLLRTQVRLHHEKIYAADCAECETREGKIDRIDRTITFEGELTAEQRARLMGIAAKCPVHRTLKSEVDIRTVDQPVGDWSVIQAYPVARRLGTPAAAPQPEDQPIRAKLARIGVGPGKLFSRACPVRRRVPPG